MNIPDLKFAHKISQYIRTNHGMEDKIVNFLTCHKISEVDSVYWNRRVDTLRRLYADRQQFINPLHGKTNCFDLKKMKGIIGKIKGLEERIDHLMDKDFLGELIREVLKDEGFLMMWRSMRV